MTDTQIDPRLVTYEKRVLSKRLYWFLRSASVSVIAAPLFMIITVMIIGEPFDFGRALQLSIVVDIVGVLAYVISRYFEYRDHERIDQGIVFDRIDKDRETAMRRGQYLYVKGNTHANEPGSQWIRVTPEVWEESLHTKIYVR